MRKRKAEADEIDGATSPQPVAGAGRSGRLTPLDIQQVEFRRSFKGYDEREVDEFLDRLTEDFAAALDETQRLRDRAEGGLGAVVAGAPNPEASRREAEQVVAAAREDAERIVREAEARAAIASSAHPAGPISAGDRAAISSFIGVERAFLTSLASLVQGHAEQVKGMASSAQRRAAPPTPSTHPSSGGAPPAAERRSGAAPHSTVAADAAEASGGASEGERASAIGQPPPGRPDEEASSISRQPARGARERAAAPGPPTPPGEGHVTIPEPRPAGVGGDPELAEGDPALRELFWGEE
jgi:DivIVA domain-containing protein